MPEMLAPSRARALFERMRGKRVLVVGDVMLDEWLWGTVERISPEAPVPVVAVSDQSFTLGGAANVASNLRAIGAGVGAAGVVGRDPDGERVRTLLDAMQVGHEALIAVDDRPTTRKTRIVAHAQQVVRADRESRAPLAAADRQRLCTAVAAAARTYDAIILSDYAKGVFSRELVEAALPAERHCARGELVVAADPKPGNIASLFRRDVRRAERA